MAFLDNEDLSATVTLVCVIAVSIIFGMLLVLSAHAGQQRRYDNCLNHGHTAQECKAWR